MLELVALVIRIFPTRELSKYLTYGDEYNGLILYV